MSRLRAVAAGESAPNLDTGQSAVIDGADPAALAVFWAAVLGYVADPSGEPDVLADPAGIGPSLRFQRGPSSAPARGRPQLHLDVTGSGPFVRQQVLVEAEVARLVALGATVVGRALGNTYGVVLADPEGNEFSAG